MSSYRFLIVAGEPSGDMYGAEVARCSPAQISRVDNLSASADSACVMRVSNWKAISATPRSSGRSKPSRHFGSLYRVFRRLVDRVEDEPPHAAILIDFPDFNLRLAKRVKEAGSPVMYYISPQVWAWREGRINQIRKLVDKMLVIFPFEEDIYRRAGVDVEFVGHPLIDMVRPTRTKEEFCRQYRLDPSKPIVALLPGSRTKGSSIHPSHDL